VTMLLKILGLVHTAQAFKLALSRCSICGKRFGHHREILHGDGITDDTYALQKMISDTGGILWLVWARLEKG